MGRLHKDGAGRPPLLYARAPKKFRTLQKKIRIV